MFPTLLTNARDLDESLMETLSRSFEAKMLSRFRSCKKSFLKFLTGRKMKSNRVLNIDLLAPKQNSYWFFVKDVFLIG